MEQDDLELIAEARVLIERPVWDSSDEEALKIMLSLVCDRWEDSLLGSSNIEGGEEIGEHD